MTMLKSIAGHTAISRPDANTDCVRYLKYGSGRAGVERYLKKESRSLATDLVNMLDRGEGFDWGREMDKLRAAVLNDRPRDQNDPRGRTRTYMHFVMSPDPEDDVSLDDLRELAVAWAVRMFGLDDPLVAPAQVAIEYHDDNANHIPHAHIVVNNTRLDNGLKIHFDSKQYRVITDELQKMSMERGLHGFSRDVGGKSVTKEELAELDAIDQPAPRRAPSRVQERGMRKAGRRMWKDDIRAAIRVACNVSSSVEEAAARLEEMGIHVEPRSARGVAPGADRIYYWPQEGVSIEDNKRRVAGETLGPEFTTEGMRRQITASRYRRLYPEDRDERGVIQFINETSTVTVSHAKVDARVANAREVDAMLMAINAYGLASIDQARRTLAAVDRQLAPSRESGKRDELMEARREWLSTLVEKGSRARILPEHDKDSRTAQVRSAAEHEQAKRERGGEKIPIEEKIRRGYRLTKAEHEELKTRRPREFREWQRNRERAQKMKKNFTATRGAQQSKRNDSAKRRTGDRKRSDGRTRKD